jgi:hypothetical protein
MQIPEYEKARFEELDQQRRRINEELDLLVQRLREGSVTDADRVRLQVQHLLVRHDGILRDMIDLLVY